MTLTPDIIKRLSFIKSFYQFAREQSKLPPPRNFISILMFHDSVELFLHLSAETLGLNLTNISFMEYFTKINKELTQRTSMDKLNRTRVSLKHKGLYPNPDDIEYFRVSTQNFFEENCPTIFGIEFADISLIDLIRDDEVREILENAQNEFDERNYEKSLELIALAFNTLLKNYEENKQSSYKSVFEIGEDLTYVNLFNQNWNSDLGKISKTVKDIQEFLKIIILNLDSKKYIKFRFLTPIIRYRGNGEYYATRILGSSKGENHNDIKFCMNFVIESALNLQEFDFEIDNTKN